MVVWHKPQYVMVIFVATNLELIANKRDPKPYVAKKPIYVYQLAQTGQRLTGVFLNFTVEKVRGLGSLPICLAFMITCLGDLLQKL